MFHSSVKEQNREKRTHKWKVRQSAEQEQKDRTQKQKELARQHKSEKMLNKKRKKELTNRKSGKPLAKSIMSLLSLWVKNSADIGFL